MKSGTIGVTTENIFPVIKQFLYSDQEIFLRELVANAVDATEKLKTLVSTGAYNGELGEEAIKVAIDAEAKTLTITDRGIGMTADEVNRYINQIAFSSAEEWVAKYKNQAIIGHFGLGFYSAFMVADRVEILTQSYKDGAKAVRWSCTGSPEYEMEELAESHDRGTTITLHLSEDCAEYTQSSRISTLLNKYCHFMAVPIVFEEKTINNTAPLWRVKPADITDEQYKEFYRELYPMSEEPLFHIHLNIDYPFHLTGILYFPRIQNNFDIQRNKISLYCNQVFVTDSVEGIVPEYLTLLHGVIDSPDIPLNVSRSYLQSDSNVKKISSYITRKVADRLAELFNTAREDYEQKWDDLKIFIEYGVLTDEKFAEKAGQFMLWKSIDGKYFTAEEYRNLITENQTDKFGNLIILYTDDAAGKHSFIEAAKAKGYSVLEMNGQLDSHYIQYYESKNEKVHFARIDSDIVENLIRKEEETKMSLSDTQQQILQTVFDSALPEAENTIISVTFEAMPESSQPVVITRNEFMRRAKEMARNGGGSYMGLSYNQMQDFYTLVINGNNPIIHTVLDQVEKSYGESLKNINAAIDAARSEQSRFDEVIKGKSHDQLTEEEKSMQSELETKLSELTSQRNARLKEIGAENSTVRQLADLALLEAGLLSGEKLSQFIARSMAMLK
ncbi:MAG: molecular chaperone HtpG [Alistipes sp.]|nr:molecular chaperone HtpG [Alistipes sp.]